MNHFYNSWTPWCCKPSLMLFYPYVYPVFCTNIVLRLWLCLQGSGITRVGATRATNTGANFGGRKGGQKTNSCWQPYIHASGTVITRSCHCPIAPGPGPHCYTAAKWRHLSFYNFEECSAFSNVQDCMQNKLLPSLIIQILEDCSLRTPCFFGEDVGHCGQKEIFLGQH